MAEIKHQAPAGLTKGTRDWYLSVVADWELDAHHIRLLIRIGNEAAALFCRALRELDLDVTAPAEAKRPPALRAFRGGRCRNAARHAGTQAPTRGTPVVRRGSPPITDGVCALWAEHGDQLLAEFVEALPGRRPWVWWQVAAPRATQLDGRADSHGAFWWGELPEPRLRLGGVGTPAYEVLSYAPCLPFGRPHIWVSTFDEEYYNGRRKDVHGQPIGTEYAEGHFLGRAIDPNDPPCYESQATYLERHDLLLPGEAKRQTPDDWAEEIVTDEAGE